MSSAVVRSLLIKAYRLVKPWLGQRARTGAHRLRMRWFGDTSQLGEALVAETLVRPGWPHWIVDVGANDGVTASNSFPFVRKGWRAVLVEPNPAAFGRLERNLEDYPRAQAVNMACSATAGRLRLTLFENDPEGLLATVANATRPRGPQELRVAHTIEVPCDTLTSILDGHDVPTDFAILSIDVEGHDLAVLEGLDAERYRPRLILTEIDEDPQCEADKRALLAARGYELEEVIGVNTVWLRA